MLHTHSCMIFLYCKVSPKIYNICLIGTICDQKIITLITVIIEVIIKGHPVISY